ncbi:MAG: ribosome biogenesis GTPase YlqF [Cyanobacteriota bacterium]
MAAPLAAGLAASGTGPQQPLIQWYPGHIAKAEQALSANLDKVDLVLEVRDARIPLATGHPRLARWIRGKPHLLVLNRIDMVPVVARQAWDDWFRQRQQRPLWCDAKAGTGVKALREAAIQAGEALNARRLERGMRPRPVRALVLGFPNVGKSALINRLVGRRVVESARRPGVTRALRWVRLGQSLDLLDAPGVLPPLLEDQRAALLLAICDDIGQAAYEPELVALAFLRRLVALTAQPASGAVMEALETRYGVALVPTVLSDSGPVLSPLQAGAAAVASADPDAWLERASRRHTSGERLRMATRLLDDFRCGRLGSVALEVPASDSAA